MAGRAQAAGTHVMGATITATDVRQPKTPQSKADAPVSLKNAIRSFALWRAKARRLGRTRNFAERINC